MIPYGLFSQLLLLVLSGTIILTFVKPTLADLAATQDKIEVYKVETSKIADVNAKLSTLVAEYNNISSADRLKLLTYMPQEVDTIAVPRDIDAIASQAGVTVEQISYKGAKVSEVNQFIDPVSGQLVVEDAAPNAPDAHQFSVVFEGSYAQIKSVLKSFEENAYPLEVYKMKVDQGEGGFLRVDLELQTYDSTKPVNVQPALQ